MNFYSQKKRLCTITLALIILALYFNSKTPEGVNRYPSSERTCFDLVTNFLIEKPAEDLENKLQIFFKELEKEHYLTNDLLVEKTDLAYKDIFPVGTTYGSRELESMSNHGKVLFQKMKANDPSSKILLKLGFTVGDGIIHPPKNYISFYTKLYKLLIQSARENGIGEKDIIFPAFLFTKDGQPKFVRPGIDPIPSIHEGWELSLGQALDEYNFSLMISEKKMILSPTMFVHDIGHFLDLIERPEYSIAYRIFNEKKISYFKEKIKNAAESTKKYGSTPEKPNMERFFNELMSMTNIKNYKKIKQIIPFLNIEQPRSFKEILNTYSEMSEEELLVKGKKFIENRYMIFSDHGGESRDGNLIGRMKEAELWLSFNGVVEGKYNCDNRQMFNLDSFNGNIEKESFFLGELEIYRTLESPGIYSRLQFLVDLKLGKTIPEKVLKYIELLAEEKNMSQHDLVNHAIAYSLSELELKIQTTLSLKISPEQIAFDTSKLYEVGGAAKYKKTATYAYYSTYPKGSPQWKRGVQVADE